MQGSTFSHGKSHRCLGDAPKLHLDEIPPFKDLLKQRLSRGDPTATYVHYEAQMQIRFMESAQRIGKVLQRP